MKAQGKEGRESYLDESQVDIEQDCEDDGLEGFTVPECGIVVPPPSHGSQNFHSDVVDALKWLFFSRNWQREGF